MEQLEFDFYNEFDADQLLESIAKYKSTAEACRKLKALQSLTQYTVYAFIRSHVNVPVGKIAKPYILEYLDRKARADLAIEEAIQMEVYTWNN